MPPAPPQQGGGSGDNHMAPMWIAIGVFVLVIILWMTLKTYVIKGFLYLKLAELTLVGFIINVSALKQAILEAIHNASQVTFEQFAHLMSAAGMYFMVPFAIVTLGLAFLLFRKSAGARFRRTYSMKSLRKEEVKNWPQITPVIGTNLIEQSIEEGPWAMARTPMQFAKDRKLLKVQMAKREEGMLSREIRMTATLIKPKARQALIRQLGRPWRGIDALNMHKKALFAMFAARMAGEVEVADDLMMQIAASAKAKKLDFTGVRELLEKHRSNGLVKQIIQRHAYEVTVMASMLEVTRSVGVMPSANFLWLKLIDRRLWFILNSVGRQTPCVEASGPFAHWLFEKELGNKIKTPMVDKAVEALDVAVKEVIYTPDDKDE